MNEKIKKILQAFMKSRFPHDKEESSYWKEWEKRFNDGMEWQLSDYSTRRFLKELAPDVYPDDQDEFFIRD